MRPERPAHVPAPCDILHIGPQQPTMLGTWSLSDGVFLLGFSRAAVTSAVTNAVQRRAIGRNQALCTGRYQSPGSAHQNLRFPQTAARSVNPEVAGSNPVEPAIFQSFSHLHAISSAMHTGFKECALDSSPL